MYIYTHAHTHTHVILARTMYVFVSDCKQVCMYACMERWGAGVETQVCVHACIERWGAGVETQKNVRGEIWGWGRVPFNEPYASSLSTIYDGA